MEEKKNILTAAGLKEYEDELHELKVVKLHEVAEKIKEARALGDLSENAEYHAAKEEQGHIQDRINELQAILKNAEVLKDDEVDTDSVNIGCSVKVLDLDESEEIEYKLVGSTEAKILEGKISNESPVGKALLGHKIGDAVEIEAPGGTFSYKILDIWKEDGKGKRKGKKK